MESVPVGLFPCQAEGSWKVGAEHCVCPCISHSLEHNDRKQMARVSVLDLIFVSFGYGEILEQLIIPMKRIPK